jgi:hypothetical protein
MTVRQFLQIEDQFEQAYGYSFDELDALALRWADHLIETGRLIECEDGACRWYTEEMSTVISVGRSGAQSSIPGWDDDRQTELESAARQSLSLRVMYPRLVAAITLDARSKWGILPDTTANRLIVGHHMRKQLFNAELRKSAIDQNVGVVINLFFVPHAGDLISRGQALHWRTAQRWSDYDLQGLSWWERLAYSGRPSAQKIA